MFRRRPNTSNNIANIEAQLPYYRPCKLRPIRTLRLLLAPGFVGKHLQHTVRTKSSVQSTVFLVLDKIDARKITTDAALNDLRWWFFHYYEEKASMVVRKIFPSTKFRSENIICDFGRMMVSAIQAQPIHSVSFMDGLIQTYPLRHPMNLR